MVVGIPWYTEYIREFFFEIGLLGFPYIADLIVRVSIRRDFPKIFCRFIPFFRIASGSFALGAPAVLGATEVPGVLMGVELLEGASREALGLPFFSSSMPREAVALVKSPWTSASDALAFLKNSMVDVVLRGKSSF